MDASGFLSCFFDAGADFSAAFLLEVDEAALLDAEAFFLGSGAGSGLSLEPEVFLGFSSFSSSAFRFEDDVVDEEALELVVLDVEASGLAGAAGVGCVELSPGSQQRKVCLRDQDSAGPLGKTCVLAAE